MSKTVVHIDFSNNKIPEIKTNKMKIVVSSSSKCKINSKMQMPTPILVKRDQKWNKTK